MARALAPIGTRGKAVSRRPERRPAHEAGGGERLRRAKPAADLGRPVPARSRRFRPPPRPGGGRAPGPRPPRPARRPAPGPPARRGRSRAGRGRRSATAGRIRAGAAVEEHQVGSAGAERHRGAGAARQRGTGRRHDPPRKGVAGIGPGGAGRQEQSAAATGPARTVVVMGDLSTDRGRVQSAGAPWRDLGRMTQREPVRNPGRRLTGSDAGRTLRLRLRRRSSRRPRRRNRRDDPCRSWILRSEPAPRRRTPRGADRREREAKVRHLIWLAAVSRWRSRSFDPAVRSPHRRNRPPPRRDAPAATPVAGPAPDAPPPRRPHPPARRRGRGRRRPHARARRRPRRRPRSRRPPPAWPHRKPARVARRDPDPERRRRARGAGRRLIGWTAHPDRVSGSVAWLDLVGLVFTAPNPALAADTEPGSAADPGDYRRLSLDLTGRRTGPWWCSPTSRPPGR